MIRHIPPGGNWKNIPASIPSRRLEQIRDSYAKGGGSRSTYYGRLRWDRPAYTISTYFNRPGNGCYLHPSANRLITVREAARLQSFPDWYHFYGSRASVYKQVGNAVPPLLAFAIARNLDARNFVDLFCGAGGLSLGFEAAGSQLITAADIDEDFCETYRRNRDLDPTAVVQEDLSTRHGRNRVATIVRDRCGSPDVVIGGPPCQGFSHAGNARSSSDPRNLLVFDFLELVRQLNPRIVMMENVPGLLTLQRPRVLDLVLKRFARAGYPAMVFSLHAETVGLPQRRHRVFIVGSNDGIEHLLADGDSAGSQSPNVADAMSDLPPEPVGSPEERVRYSAPPRSSFAALARGHLDYGGFLNTVQMPGRSPPPRQQRLPLVPEPSVRSSNEL